MWVCVCVSGEGERAKIKGEQIRIDDYSLQSHMLREVQLFVRTKGLKCTLSPRKHVTNFYVEKYAGGGGRETFLSATLAEAHMSEHGPHSQFYVVVPSIISSRMSREALFYGFSQHIKSRLIHKPFSPL